MAHGHAAGHGVDLTTREPGHGLVSPATVAEMNGGRKASGWQEVVTCILGGRFVMWGVDEM